MPLLIACLLSIAGPVHTWAEGKSKENADEKAYLKYTPEDFVESIGLKPPVDPDEEEKKAREYKIFLRTLQAQKYFVATEPVKVIFELYVPFDVRISNLDLRGKLEPFELVSLNSGERMSAPGLKKYEKQKMVLTLRLPGDSAYGIYKIPPLDIFYEYEKASDGKKDIQRKMVTSKPVEFRKVPLFVSVIQQQNTCFIGDALSFSIEIHADGSAEVLNEHPPQGSGDNAAYLSEYRPSEPFVLIHASREEAVSQGYRIIRWGYIVSPHDIREGALYLSPPQVMWRQRINTASSSGPLSAPEKNIGVHTVTPEPLSFKVLRMTEDHDAFRPMKMIQRDPGNERVLLSTIPRIAVWMLLAAVAALALAKIAQIIRIRRAMPLRAVETEVQERARLEYDSWFFVRFLLKPRILKACEKFNDRHDKESCTELRSLLARRAAFRYGKRRVSVQEACAMTASEIVLLAGDVPEAVMVRELDRQLETGRFIPLRGCGELGNVI